MHDYSAQKECQHAADLAAFAAVSKSNTVCLVSVDDYSQGQVILNSNFVTTESLHWAIHTLCQFSKTDLLKVVQHFPTLKLDNNVYGLDTVLFKDQDEFEQVEMELAQRLLQQADVMPAREIRLELPTLMPCDLNACSAKTDIDVLHLETDCQQVGFPDKISIVSDLKFISISFICLVAIGKQICSGLSRVRVNLIHIYLCRLQRGCGQLLARVQSSTPESQLQRPGVRTSQDI